MIEDMNKPLGLNNVWIGLNAGNYDKPLNHTIAIGVGARPEHDYEFVMTTKAGDFIRYDMSKIEASKMHDYFLNLLISVS